MLSHRSPASPRSSALLQATHHVGGSSGSCAPPARAPGCVPLPANFDAERSVVAAGGAVGGMVQRPTCERPTSFGESAVGVYGAGWGEHRRDPTGAVGLHGCASLRPPPRRGGDASSEPASTEPPPTEGGGSMPLAECGLPDDVAGAKAESDTANSSITGDHKSDVCRGDASSTGMSGAASEHGMGGDASEHGSEEGLLDSINLDSMCAYAAMGDSPAVEASIVSSLTSPGAQRPAQLLAAHPVAGGNGGLQFADFGAPACAPSGVPSGAPGLAMGCATGGALLYPPAYTFPGSSSCNRDGRGMVSGGCSYAMGACSPACVARHAGPEGWPTAQYATARCSPGPGASSYVPLQQMMAASGLAFPCLPGAALPDLLRPSKREVRCAGEASTERPQPARPVFPGDCANGCSLLPQQRGTQHQLLGIAPQHAQLQAPCLPHLAAMLMDSPGALEPKPAARRARGGRARGAKPGSESSVQNDPPVAWDIADVLAE